MKARVYAVCGIAGLLAAAISMAAPARFPLTKAEVSAALAVEQPGLAHGRLQMPFMTASEPLPDLLVQSVEPFGSDTVHVRLACREAGVCLPFLVTVRGKALALAPHLAASVPTSAPAAAEQDTVPLIRAGSHATLHIDSGGLHITLPVICLETGEIGHTVRAVSLDRRQSFVAEIVGKAELKGSL